MLMATSCRVIRDAQRMNPILIFLCLFLNFGLENKTREKLTTGSAERKSRRNLSWYFMRSVVFVCFVRELRIASK